MKLLAFIAVCAFVCITQSESQTIDPRIRVARQIPGVLDLKTLPLDKLGNLDVMGTVQGVEGTATAAIPGGLPKIPQLPILQG